MAERKWSAETVTPVNVTGDFSDDWVYLEILALGAVSALNQNRTEPSEEEEEQFIVKLTLLSQNKPVKFNIY